MTKHNNTMVQRCYICDASAYGVGSMYRDSIWTFEPAPSVKLDYRDDKPMCEECLKIVYSQVRENREKDSPDDNLYGLSQDVLRVLKELEDRMPDLFVNIPDIDPDEIYPLYLPDNMSQDK